MPDDGLRRSELLYRERARRQGRREPIDSGDPGFGGHALSRNNDDVTSGFQGALDTVAAPWAFATRRP